MIEFPIIQVKSKYFLPSERQISDGSNYVQCSRSTCSKANSMFKVDPWDMNKGTFDVQSITSRNIKQTLNHYQKFFSNAMKFR